MHIAKLGDRVRVQCTRVPASPRTTASPVKVVEFIVGSPDIMRGLSMGVVGMTQGDQKRLKLQPTDAYGSVQNRLIRRPDAVKDVPRHDDDVGPEGDDAVYGRAKGRRDIRFPLIDPAGSEPLVLPVAEMEIRQVDQAHAD